MTADQDVVGRPSTAAVLAELMALRQRDGMTLLKVKDHCPVIQALPLTTLELARRQLADDDRHLAAYEMLRCAVTHLVPRTDFSRVLVGTLNTVGLPGLLDDRRDQLIAQLYISEKALRRLEREAYEHLAGALITADRSPCDGPTVEDWHEVTFNFAVTTTPAQLVHVLSMLSIERRQTIRHALSDALLEMLPNARAALAGDTLAHLEGPWALLRRLLGALLTNAWPPAAVLEPSGLMLAGSISDLLLGSLDPDETRQRVAIAEDSRSRIDLIDHGRDPYPNDDYYELYARTLLQLGAQIERLEIDDRWIEILRGQETGAYELIPSPT